jgi:FkbM family methyltransferase
MHWFDDPEITRRLPLLYRAYAWYSSRVVRPSSRVPGGSFLLSVLIFLTKRFGLTSEALVKVGDLTVCLDLCDYRMLVVCGEIRGPSDERRIIASCLSAGDTFLDIGANHGSFSLIAAEAVGPSGFVAAFEPQPRLAALIRRSVEANGFTNCRVLEIACADREDVSEFHVPAIDSGSASVYGALSSKMARELIRVRTARFDDVMPWTELPGRVFLKLDVEGSERAFLEGASAMIAHCRPTILLEINPSTARAAGYSVAVLLARLSAFGYERFAEVEQYPSTLSLAEVDCTRQRKLVAVPSSDRAGAVL